MKTQRGRTPYGRKNVVSPSSLEPVSVYCRIRPLDDPEEATCIKPIGETVVQLHTPENAAPRNGQFKEIQYTFQHAFDECSTQRTVFDKTALPLVDDLLAGKNGLLFTYGITGSGKTYTMTGVPQDQGILPRCLDVLFNSIGDKQAKKYVFTPDRMNGFDVQSEADAMMERQKKDILPGLISASKTSLKSTKSENGSDSERLVDPTTLDCLDDNNYAVFVSYIEIYNNYVYDLLEDLPYNTITGYKPPQTKILRTDSSDNMYVHNCTEVEVKQPQDAIDVFYKGQRRRKVAHTTLNAESSRSHSVFNIRLVQAPLDERGEEVIQDEDGVLYDSNRACVSHLALVDLAGSERTNRTKSSGDRLKEAGNINQSLMVLRTCLEFLRENQTAGGCKLVPYRDSRLTHLFKTFFDGDGKVRMIVCVNPKVAEYEETIHVMKFAEMTQEVLITKSVQSNKFEIGFTPGRRRMNLDSQSDENQIVPAMPGIPMCDFTLGPPFPMLELTHPTDEVTLQNIILCLNEKVKKRRDLSKDYETACSLFRTSLVEFEHDYGQLKSHCSELEEVKQQKEKDASRLESKSRGMERKMEEMARQLRDLEKENQLLSLQVQDKTWKIQVEKTTRERLKNDFKARLQMNNVAWEKNMEKAKRNFEMDAENQLGERDRKLDMLRDLVNDGDTPNVRRRGVAPVPTPKPRTYTTPAVIQSARSESDMSSGSQTWSSRATPSSRPATARIQTRTTATSRLAAAKSIPNISQIGLTPTSSKTKQPVVNPRYHRRSKSSGSTDVWLDHKPCASIITNTLLQPKMEKKRSVTKLKVKDTKAASKYVLTHQEQDSSDELVTKLVKGDVIRTVSGGSAVVFNDVETLKQVSPGSRKRRSPSQPMYDPDLQWTDTEERCSVALEGHRKRSKTTRL